MENNISTVLFALLLLIFTFVDAVKTLYAVIMSRFLKFDNLNTEGE